MIQNPFIISEKIIPRYFCDREKESHELINLLNNGNNVVLLSQRRIGKTGLIQFCYQQKSIVKEYITIYIDILSTSNLQEFTFLLGKEVFEVIKHKKERMWKSFLNVVKSFSGKIGFDPMTGLPSFNLQLGDIIHPEYTLQEIFKYLDQAEKPVIVAIDEFQQISNYPEKNVEALIRSHLLQINNCRMIFSGSEQHILSDMFTLSSRPFYQSASFMELTEIPENLYVSFILKMFHQHEKSISRPLASRIYDMFDGITFYIQRVCNGVFSNTEHRGEATEEILNYTIDGLLGSFDVIYRVRLSQLTVKQKELLIAIAKEKEVERPTSVEFVKKYALSSASSVQTALKALVKYSLVTKRVGHYLIEDRFLRIWLVKNY